MRYRADHRPATFPKDARSADMRSPWYMVSRVSWPAKAEGFTEVFAVNSGDRRQITQQ
jgi:hypothetical protein